MAIEHINEFDTLNAGREKINKALDDANAVLREATDKDIISAPEIIVARDGATTLGERLDSEKAEVSAQLAQNVKNANMVDKLEKLISVRGMYACKDDDNSLRIGIGMNKRLNSIVEYRFVHNSDGLLLLRGVLTGVEDESKKPTIISEGTFNTQTAGQAYAMTIGSKIKSEFTGKKLYFKYRSESRGGIWKITLSNGLSRIVSCYNTSPQYVEELIFDNLPYKTYTVVAEFMGDDPLNAPSEGSSRGYYYYSVNGLLPFKAGDLLPIETSTAKYIVSPNSVPDYAIQGRKADSGVPMTWSPVHGSSDGVSKNVSIKLKIDDEMITTVNQLPSFTYKEIDSFEIWQQFDAYNRNQPTEALWRHNINHIISKRLPYLTVQNSLVTLQDVDFGDGYFGMLPSQQSTVTKLILNNGVRYDTLPVTNQEDYYGQDVTSAVFTGLSEGNTFHACAIDVSSAREAYNLGKSYEPTERKSRISFRTDDIAKVYFTLLRWGNAPVGSRMACQNRIACVTGLEGEHFGI